MRRIKGRVRSLRFAGLNRVRERDFIKRIAAAQAKQGGAGLVAGIGDDCAIFSATSAAEDFLVTSDMLVERVHFDTSWHPPYLLGRKAIGVNISDIAAMAGLPRYALLSIGLGRGYDDDWLADLMDGVSAHLQEHGCLLIGGDTVASEQLTINVTIIGVAERGGAIRRHGARVGDRIFVSGPLGSAAAGLALFQNSHPAVARQGMPRWPNLVNRHLDPIPRVALARELKSYGGVTAMQDISDGIATDLSHICVASNVGATVVASSLPVHPELVEMCRETGADHLDLQLRGGEDYELLFTVQPGVAETIAADFRGRFGTELHSIGEIRTGQGVLLKKRDGNLQPITYQGYEHGSS